MPRVALDDLFHSHPKIVAAGLDGAGLYARALSYCGCHLTDGFVPRSWALEIAPKKVVDKVTAAGLWEATEDGMGFRIPDYLQVNYSRAEVEEYRSDLSRKRSDSGRKGAARRWQGHSKRDGKPMAKPSQTDGPQPKPEPSTASRQLYESLDPGRRADVDRILERITGADEQTPNVIAFYAQSLPEGALAKVRESVDNQKGDVGPGWVVNALKDEAKEAA